jgi:peptidoglycan/LPS O-acetylase OafA/YrhL
LVLPLFLLVLMKLGAKQKDPFAPIPAVFLLVAIGSLWLRLRAKPASIADYYTYLLPTHLRMDSLFCGVTIGYFFHFKPQLLARVTSWRLLIAAGMLLTPVYFVEMEYRWMYTWGLTCTFLGFACIVAWVLHVPVAPKRLLALPISILARIGFYSYSIYLWHWMVIYYLRPYFRYKCMTTGSPIAWNSVMERWQWLASVALSILVGIAMAVVIEQPVLRFRDRWFPSRTRSTSGVSEESVETSPLPEEARVASAVAESHQ